MRRDVLITYRRVCDETARAAIIFDRAVKRVQRGASSVFRSRANDKRSYKIIKLSPTVDDRRHTLHTIRLYRIELLSYISIYLYIYVFIYLYVYSF